LFSRLKDGKLQLFGLENSSGLGMKDN